MKSTGNEVRTGILVVFSLTILVGVLLYLGAPGVFVPQHTYFIYFENAYGIKPGADVMVAGRKVGQVHQVFSPIPESERPEPRFESIVEVKIAAKAAVFNKVNVQMIQTSMLGDMMIDFANGEESSGLAPEGTHFMGLRQPGLSDAVPQVLEKLDPMVKKATATLDSLQKTSDNLTSLTADEGDLHLSLVEFRKLGVHLNELAGPAGPLRISLDNIQRMTGEDSDLARTLANAESFTNDLANNKDIEVALRNLRRASANVDRTVLEVAPKVNAIGQNLEQASDTIKRQPWRLIWPTTKKYGDEPSRNTVKAPTFPPVPGQNARRLVGGH